MFTIFTDWDYYVHELSETKTSFERNWLHGCSSHEGKVLKWTLSLNQLHIQGLLPQPCLQVWKVSDKHLRISVEINLFQD